MTNEDYTNTPILVKKPGKFYLWILVALVSFFLIQVSLRFFPRARSQAGKDAFVEDPNHTVFKEEDIANLPAEVADVLINKGKVEEIKEE